MKFRFNEEKFKRQLEIELNSIFDEAIRKTPQSNSKNINLIQKVKKGLRGIGIDMSHSEISELLAKKLNER